MSKYKYILFDLDGTLTDSGEGILNGVTYALDKIGFEPQPREKLNCFIGPVLRTMFAQFCNISEQEALVAVKYYREYYSEKGVFENRLYPDVIQMLQSLKQNEFKLAIASCKPDKFVNIVLEHYDLDNYFDFVSAASWDGKIGKKSEVVAAAMAFLNATPEQTVMVGDRFHDIDGAKKNSIDSIGVLYGYGGRKELTEAGATFLADTPQDIVKILKN